MTFSRIFLFVAVLLFGGIGIVAFMKKQKRQKPQAAQTTQASSLPQNKPPTQAPIDIDVATLKEKNAATATAASASASGKSSLLSSQQAATPLPELDRVALLFQKNSPLPIVETIQYKSKVSWKRGRPAWLVDYASHYKTHLHFIARSLNGRPDYTPRAAREGESFTILAQDIDFHFHIVIDIMRCRMWLYYVLPEKDEHMLLKTYHVGLGRLDSKKPSGSLTPVGKYSLGSRIAVYQPKMMGTHRGQKVEMIRVFGTRWLPFEKELGGCSERAKGYGIHGTPFRYDEQQGKLVDNTDSIGKYDSDGCIRLRSQDIEELFAIVSIHETVVEIVSDFTHVKLPGKERVA